MSKISSSDIRWKQRLNNFLSAYSQLKAAVELSQTRDLTDLEKQGLIQAFEFTHELAWNVLKDYFEYQGNSQITGSRDATREAFNKNLIQDGEAWMDMIKSRNQTSHTYNRGTANDIANKIISSYFLCFTDFYKKMQELNKK